MLVFVIPIIAGCIAIMLGHTGNKLKDGRNGTKFQHWCFRHDGKWAFSTFVSAIVIVFALIFLAGNHVDYASFPSEYKAAESTLLISRIGNTITNERAAAILKMIEINQEIAKVRYWNDSIWVGWFWPDKVAKLRYIE